MPDEQPLVITTNEFELTPEIFFNILLFRRFGVSEVLPIFSNSFLAILIVPFVIYTMFRLSLTAALAGCGVVTGLYVLLYLWPLLNLKWYVRSPENRSLYTPRQYEIDSESIDCYVSDGGFSKVPLRNLIKVECTAQYYLLYVAKNLFVYLPVDGFRASEDVMQFDTLLKAQGVPVEHERKT